MADLTTTDRLARLERAITQLAELAGVGPAAAQSPGGTRDDLASIVRENRPEHGPAQVITAADALANPGEFKPSKLPPAGGTDDELRSTGDEEMRARNGD